MKPKRLQAVVIGLGPFGLTLCRALHEMGHEVMAIDPRADVVQGANDAHIATYVAEADPESLPALRELSVASTDVVVVARGTDFEASMLIVMNLLELGVGKIVVKAVNERHAEVLERVGGERVRVINPERDMGLRLANQLTGQDIMEAVWVDPDHSFAEKPLPPGLAGQTLAGAQFRQRYGVSVVAIRRGERLLIAPEPERHFEAADRVVLLGRNDRLADFGR